MLPGRLLIQVMEMRIEKCSWQSSSEYLFRTNAAPYFTFIESVLTWRIGKWQGPTVLKHTL